MHPCEYFCGTFFPHSNFCHLYYFRLNSLHFLNASFKFFLMFYCFFIFNQVFFFLSLQSLCIHVNILVALSTRILSSATFIFNAQSLELHYWGSVQLTLFSILWKILVFGWIKISNVLNLLDTTVTILADNENC